ncbi:hypothetical protein EK21DRAFT_79767 [Setomelanomma holmii]|uniref:Uncharacterized protein n=1 Tax=Setomelanomma holmii TaxID=210430 RepID=A0A9P4GWG9_9PLEO|nr:hypothetical protein EK21DRAFT_79767 [Setomelanomma holmii]
MTVAPFVQSWAPLKIDALGIVTMLGAKQVDTWIGRLTYSYITDMLPLLGAFVIAGNSFTEPIPGFVLHNVTDGIVATDLAGWFTRWLLCQNISFSQTTISISLARRPRSRPTFLIAYSLAVLSIVPVMALSVLGSDWWGFANTVAMAVSILVRKVVTELNRTALDVASDEAEATDLEEVKVFLTMSTGQGLIIRTSRAIVIKCLLSTPQIPKSSFYNLIRGLGWLAFGCHVIALGMSSFVVQLITVVIMVSATVLATRGVGDTESRIGRRLLLERSDLEGKAARARLFANLDMTETEENSMVHWNMFPQRSNAHWWSRYQTCKQEKSFEKWGEMLILKP